MSDDPRMTQAAQLLSKGIAALKAKKLREAREIMLQARKLDPNNTDILLWLTRTTRDPESRRRILEKVLEIDPNHVQAQHALERLIAQLPEQEEDEAADAAPRFIEDDEVETEAPLESAPPPRPVTGPLMAAPDAAPPAAEDDGPKSPTQDLLDMREAVLAQGADDELSVDDLLDDGAEEALPEEDADEAFLGIAEEDDISIMSRVSMLRQEMSDEGEEADEEPSLTTQLNDIRDQIAAEAEAEMDSALAMPEPALDDLLPESAELVASGEDSLAQHLQPDVDWPEAARARRCLNCGSINIAPQGSKLMDTPCPLCGHKLLDQSLATFALPDAYLPFKIKEAEAAIAIEDADIPASARRLFGGKRVMSRPRQTFLPVYIFNGTGQVTYGLEDGPQDTHSESYSMIPVHVVTAIEDRLLRLASNVEYRGLARYKSETGRRSFVLLPVVALTKAMVDARLLMLEDARQKARQAAALTLRDSTALVRITDSAVQDMAYQLVMLPVWINDVREGSKTYMGLVNGITGQAAIGEPAKRLRRR